MPGTRRLTAAARSKYAVPGSSGSIPPCMQTSVAPRRPRLLGPVGDLVERERVGVGVGAPLGEGAEPAADVADVGEVDVAVDDVGDLVADGVAAQVVGQPAHLARAAAPSAVTSVSACSSVSAGRVALGGGAARPARRRAAPPGPPATGPGRRRAVADVVPVAVHLVEVAAPVGGAALGVDARVQVGATGAARRWSSPPSGSCHGSPVGRTPGAGQAVGRRRARRRAAETRGSSHGSPRSTYSGCTVSRGRSSRPALGRDLAQPVERGPGPLGVHVVGGERRDAAPVVDAGVEQRPALAPGRRGWAAPAPAPSGRARAG